jgi:Fe-S cluster assembly protein SufB
MMDTDFSFLKNKESDYFYKPARYLDSADPGLTESVIEKISQTNADPAWLRELRYAAFEKWKTLEMPGDWAPDLLSGVDFSQLNYYRPVAEAMSGDWDSLSDPIKETFEDLGVRKEQETFLGGLKAQFDNNVVFSSLNDHLAQKGIVFVDSVTGLRDYPDLFKDAFCSLIPYDSNKLSALNTAVFSGGAFLYVPPGVKVGMPLKSYFRINEAGCGQFGRTVIVVGEGAELTFMEGCSAAEHEVDSMHNSVGEIIAHKNSSIQYITFQNWSRQIYNLVQMRSIAHEGAHVRWLDCNVGGKLTMKYPSTILDGEHSRSEIISIGFATTGQYQDTGGKMLHKAPDTRSSIVSKSISIGEGRASYRGFVEVDAEAHHCMNNTECDALLINTESRTDTYPAICVSGNANAVQHEASVSRISEEQIFYMRQRGMSEDQAVSLSINGFINDLVKEFPLEYSALLRHLINLEMEGSVG